MNLDTVTAPGPDTFPEDKSYFSPETQARLAEAKNRARYYTESARTFIHGHPFTSLGAAVGAGLLLTALWRRQS